MHSYNDIDRPEDVPAIWGRVPAAATADLYDDVTEEDVVNVVGWLGFKRDDQGYVLHADGHRMTAAEILDLSSAVPDYPRNYDFGAELTEEEVMRHVDELRAQRGAPPLSRAAQPPAPPR